MIHNEIESIRLELKEAFGLNHVFFCYGSGIGVEFTNYGFIKLLSDEDAKMFFYEELEGCREYRTASEYVFIVDLVDCADLIGTHDLIVEYFMRMDNVIVTNSGYDQDAIFQYDTGSDNIWESETKLIAIWFNLNSDVDYCGPTNKSFKLC